MTKRRDVVIIESPYSGDIKRNEEYLCRAMRDSIFNNELPLASHKLFPGSLDEDIPSERELGIKLGYDLWRFADKFAFYCDYGISKGMQLAIEELKIRKIYSNSVMRYIGRNPR